MPYYWWLIQVPSSTSSTFQPPPLSDPESLWFPVELLNLTLQRIQDALFVERKVIDDSYSVFQAFLCLNCFNAVFSTTNWLFVF